MRDPNRIPVILKAIKKVWTRNPDLRLGQLIVNAVDTEDNVFYIEDENLLFWLEELYKEYEENTK